MSLDDFNRFVTTVWFENVPPANRDTWKIHRDNGPYPFTKETARRGNNRDWKNFHNTHMLVSREYNLSVGNYRKPDRYELYGPLAIFSSEDEEDPPAEPEGNTEPEPEVDPKPSTSAKHPAITDPVDQPEPKRARSAQVNPLVPEPVAVGAEVEIPAAIGAEVEVPAADTDPAAEEYEDGAASVGNAESDHEYDEASGGENAEEDEDSYSDVSEPEDPALSTDLGSIIYNEHFATSLGITTVLTVKHVLFYRNFIPKMTICY